MSRPSRFKVDFEKRGQISASGKLASCVFAIPGSQIDNERVFSAAGVMSKTVETAFEYKIWIL